MRIERSTESWVALTHTEHHHIEEGKIILDQRGTFTDALRL